MVHYLFILNVFVHNLNKNISETCLKKNQNNKKKPHCGHFVQIAEINIHNLTRNTENNDNIPLHAIISLVLKRFWNNTFGPEEKRVYP